MDSEKVCLVKYNEKDNKKVVFDKNIDVRIISLGKNKNLSKLDKLFPNSDIQYQRGVDIRKASLKNIYNAGIIGQAGYDSINEGRKRHSELNSIGGIGLAFANRFAMQKNFEKNLLLFEDDYYIVNEKKFISELSTLYSNTDLFDLAVFGALYHGDEKNLVKVPFMPNGWYYILKDKFWFLQCSFYSTEGRKKISELLTDEPLDMQIDSLYSLWAETKGIRIILQLDNASVKQKVHFSSIQTDKCTLCDFKPSTNKYVIEYHLNQRATIAETMLGAVVLVLLLVLFLYLKHTYNSKKMSS
jgi:hypothetical protein